MSRQLGIVSPLVFPCSQHNVTVLKRWTRRRSRTSKSLHWPWTSVGSWTAQPSFSGELNVHQRQDFFESKERSASKIDLKYFKKCIDKSPMAPCLNVVLHYSCFCAVLFVSSVRVFLRLVRRFTVVPEEPDDPRNHFELARILQRAQQARNLGTCAEEAKNI